MFKNVFLLNQVFKNYYKVGLITTGLLFYNKYLTNKRIICKQNFSSNYFCSNYLLEYNKSAFIKKRCPKILFLTDNTEDEIQQDEIKTSFQKIYQKYNEIESYFLNLRDVGNISELRSLFKEYGYDLDDFIEIDDDDFKLSESVLQKLKTKPFYFINKYGDVKNYSLEDFKEISKAEAVSTYFEKLTILTHKQDILGLNDYDYLFFIYRKTNIDYNDNIFRVFRKIYFNLNFFNIKFFVATPENTPFLNNLEENNIYLLKRQNMLNQPSENNKLKFEGEDFEIYKLTNDLNGLEKQNDSKIFYKKDLFMYSLMKILINRFNFIYYTSSPFHQKQAIEILNLYFKDTPYYALFTDLRYSENKEKLNEIFKLIKEECFKGVRESFAVVVLDNMKVIVNNF
jgi:hypothetical protein